MEYIIVVVYNKDKEHTGHLYKTENSWGVSWNDCQNQQRAPEKFTTKEKASVAGDNFIDGDTSCSYIVVEVN